MTIQETRTQGIGNGFKVLNPADGYRQDNQLWFGECANCGERVTNSLFGKGWEHELILEQKVSPNGFVGYKKSRQIDYCPKNNV